MLNKALACIWVNTFYQVSPKSSIEAQRFYPQNLRPSIILQNFGKYCRESLQASSYSMSHIVYTGLSIYTQAIPQLLIAWQWQVKAHLYCAVSIQYKFVCLRLSLSFLLSLAVLTLLITFCKSSAASETVNIDSNCQQ